MCSLVRRATGSSAFFVYLYPTHSVQLFQSKTVTIVKVRFNGQTRISTMWSEIEQQIRARYIEWIDQMIKTTSAGWSVSRKYTVQLYLTLAVVADVMTTAKVSGDRQSNSSTNWSGNEQQIRVTYIEWIKWMSKTTILGWSVSKMNTVQLHLSSAVAYDVMITAKVSFNGQSNSSTLWSGNELQMRAEWIDWIDQMTETTIVG